ncbi:uncharacterized protein KD926_007794 [Aspergillus affinis]|uniref:uncharacterized protein n=1 Tax=Aspergillus affinis TaxID=1070780 RepID=UPI0022FDE368|nr:uncharacterized protein KD926_007794 [Aspergillus affinis]KAI9040713.1 hypothetical protein KD926_007794 [Aspergillus affinis]
MKIQIVSDLHLESPAAYDVFEITPKAPYLALLGDIGYAKDAGLFDFLRKQLEAFRVVLFVSGNHEAYHSSWPETKSALVQLKKRVDDARGRDEALGELVVLDQARHDISPTTTILGCTLFSHVAEAHKQNVSLGMNDFYLIDDWTVETHQEAHAADVAWLNEQVDHISRSEPERKIVVFTHYCPSTDDKVVDPKHANTKIMSAFMSDLSTEPCWENPAVKLWAFGHTHYNCDFQDSKTGKVVTSNQRGYYFAQSEGFDCEKTFEV